MCSSRKYPYLSLGRDFSNTSPPLLKFQLSLIHFFKFFGLIEPPTPQEIATPSVRGSMDIFWNCTIKRKKEKRKNTCMLWTICLEHCIMAHDP